MTITVMTWNVHGSVDRNGDGNAGEPKNLLKELLATAKAYKHTVIGLQELCYKQHRKFRTELNKLGYISTMTYVTESGGCNDKGEWNKSGNALYLLTSKVDWRSSTALPWGKNSGTPGIQPRRILAARMKGSTKTFCVTHLGPGDPDRGEQAAKCREVMLKWDKLSDLILLGDFNMNAQSMATYFPEFYFFGNTIDLVGATTTTGVRAVVPSIYSDHSQVLVTVQ